MREVQTDREKFYNKEHALHTNMSIPQNLELRRQLSENKDRTHQLKEL